jgi:hypothetical protein
LISVFIPWGPTKVFSPALTINIQRLLLVYFSKALSFSINALVHSIKPVFEAVIEIFFGEGVNGFF